MIYEIKPLMFDTPNTREALRTVMEQFNITEYYVAAMYLTIELSEEDAVLFTLVDGDELVWERFMGNRDFRNPANNL